MLARAAAKGLITGVPPEAIQKPSKSATKKSVRKKDKTQKMQHIKRSKSQPDKDVSQRVTGHTGPSLTVRPNPMAISHSAPDNTPIHRTTMVTFRKKLPASPCRPTVTVASPATDVTPTKMLQPHLFPSPVPFGLSKDQRQSERPASPPPHRKVVQHPKPFR